MQITEVKNQLVATIALINDEDKILLGKRPVGKPFENLWEFPGGKVKPNETAEDAVIREVKEEINVDLKDEELAARRAEWSTRGTDYNSGAIWKYAQTVGSAEKGAVTHSGAAAETHVYADI